MWNWVVVWDFLMNCTCAMAVENICGMLERECDTKVWHAFALRDTGALSPDAGLWYPRGEALGCLAINHIHDLIHMYIVVVIKWGMIYTEHYYIQQETNNGKLMIPSHVKVLGCLTAILKPPHEIGVFLQYYQQKNILMSPLSASLALFTFLIPPSYVLYSTACVFASFSPLIFNSLHWIIDFSLL